MMRGQQDDLSIMQGKLDTIDGKVDSLTFQIKLLLELEEIKTIWAGK
jgi:hypothetical protein